jgi:surfactin synthase thioesterase subunit
MRNKWLPFKRPSEQADLRIFAFPYAGGGASSLCKLSQQMPASIDLCPVQLPGREGRLAEPPVTELTVLGEMLSTLGEFLHRPYACLGSMGAISLEFASAHHSLPAPTHFLLPHAGPSTPTMDHSEPPIDHNSFRDC